MSDTLYDYGHNFQLRTIGALLRDKNFALEVSDTIEPRFFDAEASQWLVEKIMGHFNKYDDVPTLPDLKVELLEVKTPALKDNITTVLREIVVDITDRNTDFIKDKSAEFFKNQQIKDAILKSVDKLENQDYDSIQTLMDKALRSGNNTDIGIEYETMSVEERYKEAARKTVACPWDVINDITEGGFGPGELVVVMAGPGLGKSWWLTNVGVHAAKAGSSVIHYTLELNAQYTAKRYDAVISGIATEKLKFHPDEVQKHIDSIAGQLTITKLQQSAATVNTIRAHAEKLKMMGRLPDVMIVDYADLLRGPGKDKRDILGQIYIDLRALADDLQVRMYTASQVNREGQKEDIVQGDNVSEDFSKIMTSDFIVSLSRKLEDKLVGTGRWHIVKNRFGPDGLTFPSKMNMTTGKFDLHPEKSQSGIDASKQANTGDVKRRNLLGQKYREKRAASNLG